MKKIIKQKPQGEQAMDILKRIAKRVEEATVDIHDIKINLKRLIIKIYNIENSTNITKVDVEKIREKI